MPINVYKNVAESTGYWKVIETHAKMWKTLEKLRDEIDFGVVDAWKHQMGVRFRGCEPPITSYNPVICNNNFE